MSSEDQGGQAVEMTETSHEDLVAANDALQRKVEQALRAKRDLEHLIVSTEIAILFLDRALRIKRFTPRVREHFSITDSDVGRPLADVSHRFEYRHILADARGVLETLEVKEDEIRSPSGTCYLVRIRPYRTVDDRIEGVVITFIDITGSKAADRERIHLLRRVAMERNRFKEILQQMPAGVLLAEAPSGRIVFANDACHRIFGGAFPMSDSIEAYADWKPHRPDGSRYAPDDVPVARAIRYGEVVTGEDMVFPLPDGTEICLSVNAAPIRNQAGDIVLGVAAFEDITGRKQAERALKELTQTLERRVEERAEQVRQLTTSLTMSEQRERERIARVLHDDLQQILYGLGMTHDLLRDPPSREEEEALWQQANDTLDLAMETTRTLTTELRPPALQSVRLAETLQWLAMRSKEQYKLQVDVEVEGACRMPDLELRVLLYQMLRELLFNVVKHAETNVARLSAWEEPGEVRVQVTDEGKGFDVAVLNEPGEQRGGFGIAHVKERLELLGGRVFVESEPGRGTSVTLVLPLKSETA